MTRNARVGKKIPASHAMALVLGGSLTWFTAAPAAWAHKPSDSTLVLQLGAAHDCRPHAGAATRCVGGWWDIAIRDLDDVLRIDEDGNGAVTWGELRAHEAEISRYSLDRLRLSTSEGVCALEAGPLDLTQHSDGAYVSLPLSIACPAAAQALTLDYRLLFEVDAQHRGLVRIDGAKNGAENGAEAMDSAGTDADTTFVLSARDHTRRVVFPTVGKAATRTGPALSSFVAEGVRHIWGGIDHILFLVALLLPAVVRRRARNWVPVPAFRPALKDVAKIVTAFTIAHSLTLSLAALGVVQMPARLTEPAIAASVVVAAANNLFPVFGRDRWMVAFALGLLHGFGFSSVLADLGLAHGRLLAALFGFNVGVELGQLAVVATFVPLAFLLRRTVAYRRFALFGGSAVIAVVAIVWFVARIVDLPTWS